MAPLSPASSCVASTRPPIWATATRRRGSGIARTLAKTRLSSVSSCPSPRRGRGSSLARWSTSAGLAPIARHAPRSVASLVSPVSPASSLWSVALSLPGGSSRATSAAARPALAHGVAERLPTASPGPVPRPPPRVPITAPRPLLDERARPPLALQGAPAGSRAPAGPVPGIGAPTSRAACESPCYPTSPCSRDPRPAGDRRRGSGRTAPPRAPGRPPSPLCRVRARVPRVRETSRPSPR